MGDLDIPGCIDGEGLGSRLVCSELSRPEGFGSSSLWGSKSGSGNSRWEDPAPPILGLESSPLVWWEDMTVKGP